jgi:hypothetical protein
MKERLIIMKIKIKEISKGLYKDNNNYYYIGDFFKKEFLMMNISTGELFKISKYNDDDSVKEISNEW